MGWNTIDVVKKSNLFSPEQNKRFYFVHSYYVECFDSKDILGSTNFIHNFTSAFEKDNIIGMQFHPEKSQNNGLATLQSFFHWARMCIGNNYD